MGQPARLEENFVTDLKSYTKIVLGGSRSCCSPCQKSPPIDPLEDELTRNLGLVGGPHWGSISPASSRNPTPGPNLVLALISAPVFALPPTPVPTNELFKQFMKAYLESNQGPRQPLVEYKQHFKAKIPEVYYCKSHMDCYHFCQQCKDYFKIVGATGTNRTPFTTSFLCGNISMHWAQFKRRNRGEELTSITWT